MVYRKAPSSMQNDSQRRLRTILGIIDFLRATTTSSRRLGGSHGILHLDRQATQLLRLWRQLDLFSLSFRAGLGRRRPPS